MAHRLLNEKGIPFGLTVKCLGKDGTRRIKLMLRRTLEHGDHVLSRQSSQKNAFEELFPPKLREDFGERVPSIEVNVPIRPQNHQPVAF
jgi:hypothetical protein